MKDLSLEAKQKSLQSGWKGRAEESDVGAEGRAAQSGGHALGGADTPGAKRGPEPPCALRRPE